MEVFLAEKDYGEGKASTISLAGSAEGDTIKSPVTCGGKGGGASYARMG